LESSDEEIPKLRLPWLHSSLPRSVHKYATKFSCYLLLACEVAEHGLLLDSGGPTGTIWGNYSYHSSNIWSWPMESILQGLLL